MKVTPCVVKDGINAGAVYHVRTRRNFGNLWYTVDDKTGWHKSAKAARHYAESNGWIYVTNRQGQRTLVHESAAEYY